MPPLLQRILRFPLMLPLLFMGLGVLLFVWRHKTPNFYWMGVYPDPGILSWTLPFNIGTPVLRPWLWLELISLKLFGTLWPVTELAYGLLAGLCLLLLFYAARRSGSLRPYALLGAPALVMGIYGAAGGGIIYDMTASLSLIASWLLLDHLRRTEQAALSVFLLLGATLALADLSRPFLLYVVPLFLLYGFWLKRTKILWSALVLLCLAGPFHLAQYLNTGSLTLSCYSGCNLAEVFPEQRKCVEELGRQALDTPAGRACCAENAAFIKASLMEKPGLIFRAFTPSRIQQVLIPRLYWHGWGGEKWYVFTFQIPYTLLMIAFWINLLRRLYQARQDTPRLLAATLPPALITLLILLSHNGSEMVRVVMPLHALAMAVFFTLRSPLCCATPALPSHQHGSAPPPPG